MHRLPYGPIVQIHQKPLCVPLYNIKARIGAKNSTFKVCVIRPCAWGSQRKYSKYAFSYGSENPTLAIKIGFFFLPPLPYTANCAVLCKTCAVYVASNAPPLCDPLCEPGLMIFLIKSMYYFALIKDL